MCDLHRRQCASQLGRCALACVWVFSEYFQRTALHGVSFGDVGTMMRRLVLTDNIMSGNLYVRTAGPMYAVTIFVKKKFCCVCTPWDVSTCIRMNNENWCMCCWISWLPHCVCCFVLLVNLFNCRRSKRLRKKKLWVLIVGRGVAPWGWGQASKARRLWRVNSAIPSTCSSTFGVTASGVTAN